MSSKERRIVNDIIHFLMVFVAASFEQKEPPEKSYAKVECLLNVYDQYKKLAFKNVRDEIEGFIKGLERSGFELNWSSYGNAD